MNVVTLLSGPFAGGNIILYSLPAKIQIGDCIYSRIDDPETGEFLGAYVYLRRVDTDSPV